MASTINRTPNKVDPDLRAEMIATGKATLYLIRDHNVGWHITDGYGATRFHVTAHYTGRHNIARVRRDVHFIGPGLAESGPDSISYWWHGVQYGNDTDIVHCKRTRAPFRRQSQHCIALTSRTSTLDPSYHYGCSRFARTDKHSAFCWQHTIIHNRFTRARAEVIPCQ